MSNSREVITKLILVTVLTAGASSAFAANELTTSKDALCSTSLQANTALVTSLKAAKDDDAMRMLLASPIKSNPANAQCIIDAVKAQAPDISKRVFQIIVALLSVDPKNDPYVERLTEANPDIVAQIASDIEPAAGPGDTGNTQENPINEAPLENPGQLNEQDATTPPASPSKVNNI